MKPQMQIVGPLAAVVLAAATFAVGASVETPIDGRGYGYVSASEQAR
ncbi:hypothetical protein [uncultured Maritimibacter sp.]|jgi:hypothetical protein|nr:hypothetical protein [uncultured Maritimibacter sp.]